MPTAPALAMVTLVAVLLTLTRIGASEPVSASALAAPVRASAAAAPAPESAPAAANTASYSLDELLAALRLVETGGLRHEGRHATGDGGKAIGPYQIHRSYWKDSRLPGTHEDCRDPAYAREVVMAYWRRYCPRELAQGEVEVLARVHNGGPEGHRKSATLKFWRKVETELQRARSKALPKPAVPQPNPRPNPQPNPKPIRSSDSAPKIEFC